MPDLLMLSNAKLPDDFTMPKPATHGRQWRMPGLTATNGPLHIRDPLLPVCRTDVPLVTIWTTQDWTETSKKDDVTDPNQVQKKKGKTNAQLGYNMTMRYVQHQNGQVIDGYYASEIREGAYQIWHKLLLHGLAPAKWSQISVSAADFYYQEMSYRFPEL